MATLPVDSDFVGSAAYPALFGLLGTSIGKIETNEMRNDFTKPYGAEPLMVMVMVAAVMGWWEMLARSNISIVRACLAEPSLMGGRTRCTNSSPYITYIHTHYLTHIHDHFLHCYQLHSNLFRRKL